MLAGQLAEPGQEVVGRHQVAALALDRLDEHGGNALRRSDRAEQLLYALDGLVGCHSARRRRVGRMENRRQQRGKPASLAGLGGG